ncbi:hypothetical protein [Microbacterium rhizomatis]|uniref:Polymer-forming cytoskeletal protein n=1 Tax=Microbacterium rhizomatis TaxID=1631477 RepID=A0A5J5J0W5_9MICO|nr:hypothetical protein [Microbacterium rhizomatis]KAA9107987.1 hypothetical protein F6B43_11230 [Microbacterium rhizomatis]
MNAKWKVPVVALLVVGGSVVAAPAYAADLSCTTELGSQVVSGNLTVPSGAECVLGDVTVQGDIIVEADGWLDATSVVVEGDVIGTDVYGVLLDGTSVAGDISVYSAGTRSGFLYVNDLKVGGDVAAGGVDVEVTESTIAGSFTTQAANYVDLVRTSVAQDVVIDGSAFGVTVAGAIVQGSVTVSHGGRDVLVGANPDGSADAFGNSIGGDLTLSDNAANLRVAGTNVHGVIALAGNTPVAAFGAGNVARSVNGDYTGDAPAAPAAGDQSIAVTVPTQSAGELIWSLEGTSALVDLGVAEEQLDFYLAHGSIVPIRIQDTSAGNPAWSLTTVVSNFQAGGQTVSSKYLGWTPALLENNGGAVAGPAIPSGYDEGDGLSVTRTLASAPAGHARGASVATADLELKLPLDTPQGTYTATVTVTALS